MDFVTVLDVLSADAALVAAMLWFLSARAWLPTAFPLTVLSTHHAGEEVPGAEILMRGASQNQSSIGLFQAKRTPRIGECAFHFRLHGSSL